MEPISTFQEILREIMKAPLPWVAFIVLLYLLMIILTPGGRRILKRFFRVMFYSEPEQEGTNDVMNAVEELRSRVDKLKKDFPRFSQQHRERIESQLNTYLENNLDTIVDETIRKSGSVENSVIGNLKSDVVEHVDKFLSSKNVTDLVDDAMTVQLNRARLENTNVLDRTIDSQMRSAGRIKTVMINLFVLFNLGIILVYIFVGENLTQHGVYAITALYVSLATFIFYIYRTSNFRTSVLLALREDSKKYFDVIDYLQRFKTNSELTENDVDVLRMLLTNRAEREKMAHHPYEVILKAVSDSNIQFKGGKISLTKSGSKTD